MGAEQQCSSVAGAEQQCSSVAGAEQQCSSVAGAEQQCSSVAGAEQQCSSVAGAEQQCSSVAGAEQPCSSIAGAEQTGDEKKDASNWILESLRHYRHSNQIFCKTLPHNRYNSLHASSTLSQPSCLRIGTLVVRRLTLSSMGDFPDPKPILKMVSNDSSIYIHNLLLFFCLKSFFSFEGARPEKFDL